MKFLFPLLFQVILWANESVLLNGVLQDINQQPISGASIHLLSEDQWAISQGDGSFLIESHFQPLFRAGSNQLEIEGAVTQIENFKVVAYKLSGQKTLLISGQWMPSQSTQKIHLNLTGFYYIQFSMGRKTWLIPWNSSLSSTAIPIPSMNLNLLDTLKIIHQDFQTMNVPIYSYWRDFGTITLLPQIAIASSSVSSSSSYSSSSSSTNQCLGVVVQSNEFCDARDGRVYKTTRMGSQKWMAQNLAYKNRQIYQNGAWCYNDYEGNCDTYGVLYNWSTALQVDSSCVNRFCQTQLKSNHQGICPDGWRLPTPDDLLIMHQFYKIDTLIFGDYLKSKSSVFTYWNSNSFTIVSGFEALPAGHRNHTGQYYALGDWADFWTSLEADNLNGTFYTLGESTSRLLKNTSSTGGNSKAYAISVRCIATP